MFFYIVNSKIFIFKLINITEPRGKLGKIIIFFAIIIFLLYLKGILK